jgi:hypothetical protein
MRWSRLAISSYEEVNFCLLVFCSMLDALAGVRYSKMLDGLLDGSSDKMKEKTARGS